MRSRAFSCLAGLSSCFARELYSSMVRWKAVREALRDPSAAGLMCAAVGGGWWPPFGSEEEGPRLERLARSLRIEVLCLRAPLKVVFCGLVLAFWLGGEVSRRSGAHHGDCFDAMRSWGEGEWENSSHDVGVCWVGVGLVLLAGAVEERSGISNCHLSYRPKI